MSRKDRSSPSQPPFEASSEAKPPSEAEAELHRIVDAMGDRILHHSDRPEIELRILSFLTHTLGPSTEGVAREMGISPEAAAVHLQALIEADRVWSQPGPGGEDSWHLSQEGRHFLAERNAP